jgi:hypothetical protein
MQLAAFSPHAGDWNTYISCRAPASRGIVLCHRMMFHDALATAPLMVLTAGMCSQSPAAALGPMMCHPKGMLMFERGLMRRCTLSRRLSRSQSFLVNSYALSTLGHGTCMYSGN